MEQSEAATLDPSGEAPLRDAKRLRRDALRTAGEDVLLATADRAFGLPDTSLSFAAALVPPLEPLVR
jgi:hypothetical protein